VESFFGENFSIKKMHGKSIAEMLAWAVMEGFFLLQTPLFLIKTIFLGESAIYHFQSDREKFLLLVCE
jgi:hypothetical protein